MSLYNKLFDENKDTNILLGMIGVNKEYFERFRDIDLIEKGEKIKVITRTGGPVNRNAYKSVHEKLRKHDLYIKDYDDEFDITYAHIEFNIPEKYKSTAKKMYVEEPPSIKEKFEKEINEMNVPGTEAFKRAEKIMNEIIEQFDKNNDDDKNIKIIKF